MGNYWVLLAPGPRIVFQMSFKLRLTQQWARPQQGETRHNNTFVKITIDIEDTWCRLNQLLFLYLKKIQKMEKNYLFLAGGGEMKIS